MLVSDGVLDAGVVTRGEAFGVDRLLAAVNSARSASSPASLILTAVSRHLAGAAPEDDVTVMVISRSIALGAMAAREWRRAG